MKIELKILNKEFYKNHDIPKYATSGSAAVDLLCTEDVILQPQDCKMIKTGIAIHIGSLRGSISLSRGGEVHLAALIMPRSGLGHTKGLVLGNTLGLIDNDYQGELLISAYNRNHTYDKVINIPAGGRIAQMLFIPIFKPELKVVEDFNIDTQRGALGFGSTGEV